MTTMTDLMVNVSREINAPIEKVFDAWLDAKTLSRFMLPMPGMPEPRTECDGKQGGRFSIFMKVGDDEIPHSGTFLEVDRPNKLVFSWESPFSTDGSTVTLLLNSISENRTKIDLTHIKFPDEESRSNHEGGWGCILEKLDEISTTALA